jgi:hypothetical protein
LSDNSNTIHEKKSNLSEIASYTKKSLQVDNHPPKSSSNPELQQRPNSINPMQDETESRSKSFWADNHNSFLDN